MPCRYRKGVVLTERLSSKGAVVRVLVTGHRGYIGSVMVGVLRNARHDVVGLDCDYYAGCDFGRVHADIPCFDTDLRDLEFTDLLSFDAVVHLADIPESATASLGPALTDELTTEATLRLATACKEAGISRFLYASTWTVYGRGGEHLLDERSPVDPINAHSATKVRCEKALAELADETFRAVVLRHGCVYGVSPRLRMDLMINDLVASAVLTGRATLSTDGRAWRPIVHVEDLARVYAAMLAADGEDIQDQVFNVVAEADNHRTIDIADAVTELIPDCTRSTGGYAFSEPGCRMNGSRLRAALPKFTFRWSLPVGIRQLRNALIGACLTPGDWRSDRFRRALRLQTMIESGEVTADIRRRQRVFA